MGQHLGQPAVEESGYRELVIRRRQTLINVALKDPQFLDRFGPCLRADHLTKGRPFLL